ncbi:hypothetical protein QBC35DRAFT_126726 [Podospora australis]|uniref:Uncharacterized protein n=1 Tax=Podospora australis TaxID=1536484 RepID=A0AAN7ALD8_9PEZI|nr:hypothetical protein QBC35DRAFT_126726 [Podospora australis]
MNKLFTVITTFFGSLFSIVSYQVVRNANPNAVVLKKGSRDDVVVMLPVAGRQNGGVCTRCVCMYASLHVHSLMRIYSVGLVLWRR